MRSALNIKNLDYGFTNFDNFFYAMWLVFEIITLKNWSNVMYKVRCHVPAACNRVSSGQNLEAAVLFASVLLPVPRRVLGVGYPNHIFHHARHVGRQLSVEAYAGRHLGSLLHRPSATGRGQGSSRGRTGGCSGTTALLPCRGSTCTRVTVAVEPTVSRAWQAEAAAAAAAAPVGSGGSDQPGASSPTTGASFRFARADSWLSDDVDDVLGATAVVPSPNRGRKEHVESKIQ